MYLSKFSNSTIRQFDNSTINVKSLFFLLIFITIFSCQKEKELVQIESGATTEKIEQNTSQTVLGKTLDNPYSIENMEKAYKNLRENGALAEKVDIKPTHQYIKFEPKNDKELSQLKQDTTIIFYEYPLDVEIVKYGTSFHDPKVPKGTPTYQYASIPIEKDFYKKAKHSVLAKLYIPDEVKIQKGKGSRIGISETAVLLVEEAMRITNNLENNKNGKENRTNSWQPKGTLTVQKEGSTFIGLEGVEVRVRKWFTTHTGITNSNGKYLCDGIHSGTADWSIDWERYHFALREGFLNGAEYHRGENRSADWNVDFNTGVQGYYAKLFIGAYYYYYKDIEGLRRPPLNNFWGSQLHIRAHYNEGRAFFGGHKFLGIGSEIHMYSEETYVGGNVLVLSTERITNVMFHELAHASHCELRGNNWNSTSDRLLESWAMGIGWALTRKIFPDHNDYAFMSFNDMRDPNFGNYEYTTLVIDLLDTLDQGMYSGNSRPTDNIDGYNIKQIEDILGNCSTLENLRDLLKSNYTIQNQNELDTFFAQYINL